MKPFLSGLVTFSFLAVVALLALWSTPSGAGASASAYSQSAVGAGVAPGAASHVGAATPSPTCAPSWAVVDSPNAGVGGFTGTVNQLTGVSAVSADDVWSAGYYVDQTKSRPATSPKHVVKRPADRQEFEGSPYGNLVHTLVEHWDGTAWTIIPSIDNGPDSNAFFAIAAAGTNDVWATGYYLDTFGVSQTLIEHWNGTAWSLVTSPNMGPYLDNELTTVDAPATNDVWTAGYYYSEQGVARTLTEHWNGTTWSIIASPNTGALDNEIYSISFAAASDVWAVGSYVIANGMGGVIKGLLEHWNGTAWSIVPYTPIGSFNNVFYGVDAVSTTDVWAVGASGGYSSGARPLFEHWDGSSWTPVAGPANGSPGDVVYSVEAIGVNDVWAVGAGGRSNAPPQGLTEHWNGVAWSVVRSPLGQQNGYASLMSVSAADSNDLWAVGSGTSFSNYQPQTFTEHYSTACVTCPTGFADVPEGSPFYPYVQCLACQGIVNGYPCADPADPCVPSPVPTGVTSPVPTRVTTPAPLPSATGTATPSGTTAYFRPGSPVTRGQLAKIISNSSAYVEDPGSQVFTDVAPYENPFFPWINRLAHRGIIGGYACGTRPDEPCDSRHMPYFRSGGNASRGQIAKIVSNARGFNDPVPPGTQTFADVAPDSPFWLYVERLRINGSVISGYACGAVGEPCPGTYFRPQIDASRGQVSKIVSKAFFPSCYAP
ncbi:MAG: hypothetical protein M3014_02855 [Chloroflexota bacterium]|nr:hypothetical protein [Chloroflexota bacterium]